MSASKLENVTIRESVSQMAGLRTAIKPKVKEQTKTAEKAVANLANDTVAVRLDEKRLGSRAPEKPAKLVAQAQAATAAAATVFPGYSLLVNLATATLSEMLSKKAKDIVDMTADQNNMYARRREYVEKVFSDPTLLKHLQDGLGSNIQSLKDPERLELVGKLFTQAAQIIRSQEAYAAYWSKPPSLVEKRK